MVRMIRRITYEVLPSEEEALLQENKLIRKHNPPFNRAKSSHETYYFLSVVQKDGKLVFDLRMHLREEVINSTYGAFKGHGLIRKALGALLRQLYLVEHKITTPFQFPLQLINKLTPMHYEVKASEEVTKQLYHFLEGYSDQLLYTFVDHARSHNLLEPFIGKMILKDMESLRWFYRRATSRNRKIVNQFELKSHIIPQEKLDDYLVRLAFLKK
jgi:excinuclease UvrABC nuclease subunit